MDTATKLNQLESDRRAVEAYLKHPLTVELLEDNRAQQEAAINILCEHDIDSISTFFAHITAVGHLRGLRRIPSIIQDKLDELNEQIKQNTDAN